MKVILIFSFLCLSTIFAEECYKEADSYKDCKDLTVSTGGHCCYVEGKGEGACLEFNEEEYKDLDKAKKEMEGYADVDIDCHSNYLSIAFLALLFILF